MGSEYVVGSGADWEIMQIKRICFVKGGLKVAVEKLETKFWKLVLEILKILTLVSRKSV